MGIADGDNQKPRLLFCPKCETDTTNDKLNARCTDCNSPLLTVVFSKLTGERLTRKSLDEQLYEELTKKRTIF